MAHPLTNRLAATMYEADGRPTIDAYGHPITIDRYRGWADMALDALASVGVDLDVLADQIEGQQVDPGAWVPVENPPTAPVASLDARLHRAV